MGVKIPAAKDLEPLNAENAVLWEEGSDETGFVYSGTEEFKAGKGEFLALGQGDDLTASNANATFLSSPADSGVSLSAEFEGKGALLGTSATKTSQDAFAAAGTELKTILNSNGGSDFLQLALGASKRKLSLGTAKVGIEAGKDFSLEAKVLHNLKAVPAWIGFTFLSSGGSGTVINPKVTSRTESEFKFYFASDTTFGVTVEVEFLWAALG